ncbi:hypothetical protein Tco_0674219 [Tanacetum coccineum]
MSTLKFADTHNMVAFLSKPTKSDRFEQIVDFLNARPIRYALTINPTIYISCIEQFWYIVNVKIINGKAQLHALVDGKKIIITESSVRRDLQLADEEGVDYEAIHKELGDSLVRSATIASSLEAEQDSGNINKTQSKATPNESSSLETTSGGGPRCQETIGDTIAQTREDTAFETWDDIQAKIDADHQLAERLQAQEQEELFVKEKAILFQQLLEKIRKHFAAKRAEEKRNKPPTKAQQRKIMCTYLKNMEGYKLNDLKLKEFDSIQEMFDRAFKRVNTFEDFRTELVEGKEKRAGTELIQENAKKQKVEDDKETTELKQCLEIIPDEEEATIDAIL